MVLKNAKYIVVKIGSSLLTDENGELRLNWLSGLVEDINELNENGIKTVLVSSGAVSLGRNAINKTRDRLRIEEKQAAAAVGQPLLITEYSKLFKRYDKKCAQILITIPDTENRRRYLNTQNTLESLLENNIVPVVNENDTIATDELRFGDNDRLSALVGQMIMADYLVILSDIDGLYTDDPNKNPDAKFIGVVEVIDDKIKSLGKDSISGTGSGGMITKIRAAEIASVSGCKTIITSGKTENPLKKLIQGAKHTLFESNDTPVSARKNWIHNSIKCKGEIVVDQGAAAALGRGNSLLAVGIKKIKHKFNRGDIVFICNNEGEKIAKGISAYSSADLKKIIGLHSEEIADVLGYSGREYIVHIDDLVFLKGKNT